MKAMELLNHVLNTFGSTVKVLNIEESGGCNMAYVRGLDGAEYIVSVSQTKKAHHELLAKAVDDLLKPSKSLNQKFDKIMGEAIESLGLPKPPVNRLKGLE